MLANCGQAVRDRHKKWAALASVYRGWQRPESFTPEASSQNTGCVAEFTLTIARPTIDRAFP